MRLLALFLLALPMTSLAGEYTLQTHNELIVVEQSESEARSIGSLVVRYYEYEGDASSRTFFLAGGVFSRDGSIIDVSLYDVNDDGVEELVVVTESVGTGGYKNFMAFSRDAETVQLVETRSPDDPNATIQEVF